MQSRQERGRGPGLSAIPTLSDVDPESLRRLEASTTVKRVRRGTVLIRQSDRPDKLYLVLSGRFVVLLDGQKEAIAEIGPGEPLGELAFFAGVKRTANVVAARDSQVMVLSKEDYARVVQDVPEIVSAILTSVARRLARVTSASPAMRPKRPRTVALLPIGTAESLPDGFASTLAETMAPVVAVVLSPETLHQWARGEDEDRLRERIAALERDSDILLFAMDRRDSPFARACLSLADHLLLVAPASETHGDATRPGPFERNAADLFLVADRALVIWRQSGSQPIADTDQWLAQREIKLHHHVARDSRADFARLGRFLSGSALGLVLGGGAALGCAHLGVAKALQEAAEPIDFFGGTSVGAAMAGALALGLTPDEIMDRTEEIFVRHRAMRRPTIPLHSLLDHRVLDAQLRRNFAGKTIEDLPFNFFAVSASLTSNDAHVHRSGPTWEAVRASGAIPGILPPFITGSGEVLIDGAMIDNVPVAIMRRLKAGPNVVVRLRRARPWRVRARYDGFPAPGKALRNILTRRTRSHPSVSNVLVRGMILASEQRFGSVSTDGDLLLVPKGTAGVGLSDWKKGRQVADAAYRHTARVLSGAGSVSALIEANA